MKKVKNLVAILGSIVVVLTFFMLINYSMNKEYDNMWTEETWVEHINNF